MLTHASVFNAVFEINYSKLHVNIQGAARSAAVQKPDQAGAQYNSLDST